MPDPNRCRYDTTPKHAPPYHEEHTEQDVSQISPDLLTVGSFEITYRTGKGTTKSIRFHSSREPITDDPFMDTEDLDPSYRVFTTLQNGTYAYNPETQTLVSMNSESPVTVATGDEIESITRVQYPDGAPIVGAIESDVSATIHYRTAPDEDPISVTIYVTSIDWDGTRITGRDTQRERTITAVSTYERKIQSRTSNRTQTLGHVSRIEFPRGRTFTVELEGVTESGAGETAAEIETMLRKRFSDDWMGVDVSDTGDLSE